MNTLHQIVKIIAHPLYWIVYARFAWAWLLRLRASRLGVRLLRAYEPYDCGNSLVRQIRPDVGCMADRFSVAQASAVTAFDGARAAWDRLP